MFVGGTVMSGHSNTFRKGWDGTFPTGPATLPTGPATFPASPPTFPSAPPAFPPAPDQQTFQATPRRKRTRRSPRRSPPPVPLEMRSQMSALYFAQISTCMLPGQILDAGRKKLNPGCRSKYSVCT